MHTQTESSEGSFIRGPVTQVWTRWKKMARDGAGEGAVTKTAERE